MKDPLFESHLVEVDVAHGWYGCDTGCCGYRVTAKYDDDTERQSWSFDHPNGAFGKEKDLYEASIKDFAIALATSEFGDDPTFQDSLVKYHNELPFC